ncbi:UbiX family flavin prenyltransferase [Anaeromyxobacter paludicola]|uniref:Flavin prenyltransferase UbiX n=1 Tax=Anaeromyxobacter paludicola TaxID=2918171 RepID=A0ABN6NA59_9BACT|nr:UbiX family flavin prenyltransferase [Anaeromyxobacter paludicola]BDG10119.1 aromatic acid decarboxylase [Anaeromyxobacter paludicola]
MKLVVGVSGASGAPYAKRLLDFLSSEGAAHGVEADLVFTATGKQVWMQEIGAEPRYPFPIWKNHDFTAPFASGSAPYDAMCVVPCSAGQLSRIAYGLSVDLVGRAADVMLKEKRRLVLCLRETPLSLVHARAITAAIEAGAVVMPASPSFYSQPRDTGELVDTVVSRLLDRLGLPNALMRRWEGLTPRRNVEPEDA